MLADTTINELEKAGNSPKRGYLTARCVAWELSEVENWIAERRKALNVPGLVIRPNRPGKPAPILEVFRCDTVRRTQLPPNAGERLRKTISF